METQPDRIGQENKKSQDKSSDTAISAIYDVISGYNGIVANIIERTQPVKGKWSTRRSVDQSTVMYLAEVLKGLNEPLKHLEFQLNQVKDPDLATLQNMMNNLVRIIDQSPPFKMLDVEKYRFGIPNYEGLADDLDITSGKGYIALLEQKKKMLKRRMDTMKPHLRQAKGEISGKIFDHAEKTLENVEKELAKAKKLVNAQLKEVYVNAPLFTSISDAIDALDELYLPSDISKKEKVEEFKVNKLKALLKEKTKYKSEVEKAYDELMDDDGNFDAQSLPLKHKKEYLDILEDISKLERKLGIDNKKSKESKKPESTAPKGAPEGGPPEGAPEGGPPEGGPPEGGPPEGGPPEGGPPAGEGSGKPLADLLANPKQQYNSMGRPISDDQIIQNDMIKANRNWQIKNNGPHDTPLGNLNPFLAQNDASKYTYEVLLAAENATQHPEINALGADISLLQGPIATVEGSGKKSKALMKLKNVAIDEKNDPYARVSLQSNGMIPEEKEDQFKLPDLKPKKRK